MVRWNVNSVFDLEQQLMLLQWETSMRIVPLLMVRSAVTPDDTQVSAAPLTLTQAVPEASPVPAPIPPSFPPLAPPPLEQPTIITVKSIERIPVHRVASIVAIPFAPGFQERPFVAGVAGACYPIIQRRMD